MTQEELHEWARANLLPHENAETQLRFEKGEESYDEDYIRESLHTKYALFVLNESSTPIDEIEWLLRNLTPFAKEIVEDMLKYNGY